MKCPVMHIHTEGRGSTWPGPAQNQDRHTEEPVHNTIAPRERHTDMQDQSQPSHQR